MRWFACDARRRLVFEAREAVLLERAQRCTNDEQSDDRAFDAGSLNESFHPPPAQSKALGTGTRITLESSLEVDFDDLRWALDARHEVGPP